MPVLRAAVVAGPKKLMLRCYDVTTRGYTLTFLSLTIVRSKNEARSRGGGSV